MLRPNRIAGVNTAAFADQLLMSTKPCTLTGAAPLSPASCSSLRCRVRQVEQIFVDFGDGAPAVRGEHNLILGDFNTDPARAAVFDQSARRWNDFVGPDRAFHFVTKIGSEAPRAYRGVADIDHVVSDAYHGDCQHPGVDDGSSRVFEGVYFDHAPVVCTLSR